MWVRNYLYLVVFRVSPLSPIHSSMNKIGFNHTQPYPLHTTYSDFSLISSAWTVSKMANSKKLGKWEGSSQPHCFKWNGHFFPLSCQLWSQIALVHELTSIMNNLQLSFLLRSGKFHIKKKEKGEADTEINDWMCLLKKRNWYNNSLPKIWYDREGHSCTQQGNSAI